MSYEELLKIFWEEHDPAWQPGYRQYRNILFYHNEEQKRLAEGSRDRLESELGSRVVTDIVPYSGFTLAEGYHQKHSLRLFNDIMEEFEGMYPSVPGLISSTAAARVNGYVYGFGKCDDLEKEIGLLGLSPAGQARLRNIVCGE